MLDRSTTYRSSSRRLVLGSLRAFQEQCRAGFRGGRSVRLPGRYKRARNLVIVGMGGSTLGSDVVRTVFSSVLRIPVGVVNGYELPASVDQSTVVILSSYSGTTEETLAAAKEALARRAMITGLTTGGPLASFFRRHKLPWYEIVPTANPAGQPRMALGYNAMGQLGILSSAGLLRITANDVENVLRTVNARAKACDPIVPTIKNPAKKLAKDLDNQLPILTGPSFLHGAMHAFANQLNETAKSYAVSFPLPELNHHLLEGLRFPKAVRRAQWVECISDIAPKRISLRQRISRQIVSQQGLKVSSVKLRGTTALAQSFDLLTLAGFTSLYLSILHGVDPLSIPTVNQLKHKLSQA